MPTWTESECEICGKKWSEVEHKDATGTGWKCSSHKKESK